jgi:hypothetical protein
MRVGRPAPDQTRNEGVGDLRSCPWRIKINPMLRKDFS